MKFEEYCSEVEKNEPNYSKCAKRSDDNIRCLHACIGAVTETSELLDAYKKYVFYGKKIDRTNMIEEVGDTLWYLSILAMEWGFDLNEAMERNVKKLRRRYKNGFSESEAINRDTRAEYRSM